MIIMKQGAAAQKLIYQDDIAAFERRSREAAFSNADPETGEVYPSLTVQGPARDTDINTIAKAYGLTAGSKLPLPQELYDPRYYGDMTEAPETLQEAMELVQDATARFALLPAAIRGRFNHSPAFLWDFLQDPGNFDEAVELGLLFRPPAPEAPPSPEGDSK